MNFPTMKPPKRSKPIVRTKKYTKKPRGRPVKNDIMNLQGSIPATPDELARVILSTPPHKIKP